MFPPRSRGRSLRPSTFWGDRGYIVAETPPVKGPKAQPPPGFRASDRQHDLADMARCFEQAMGFGGLGQWEGFVDHRLHFARLEQRPDLLLERCRNRAFLRNGAWAQARSGQGQALAHHGAEINLGDHAALRGDADMASLDRE